MDYAEQIARIKEKAKAVTEKSPWLVNGRPPFGAEAHRYRLNPPIAPEELEAFENLHQVRLPEDYRLFLLEIANGGAGPYYGLLPLNNKWDHAVFGAGPEPAVENPRAGFLASPCPLTERSYEEDWDEHLEPYDWDPYQGAITICNQGCTYCALLIVTGEARGHVVNVDMDWQPPKFAPYPDFLSWYEAWQDSVLSGEEIHWFGYPPAPASPETEETADEWYSDLFLMPGESTEQKPIVWPPIPKRSQPNTAANAEKGPQKGYSLDFSLPEESHPTKRQTWWRFWRR